MNHTNPVLEICSGKLAGQQLIVRAEEVVIGRGESARVRIPSPEVSREHCRLTYSNRQLFVDDLGSRNGTFINGRPIQGRTRLTSGSTLTIGPITFVMLGSKVAAPQSPSSPEVQISGKSAVEQRLSDDEIVSWLSDTTDSLPEAIGPDANTLVPNIFRRYSVPEV